MCAPIYKRDPRIRFLFVIANLSLVIGLVLWAFVRPALAAPHWWIDGLTGLFMGMSISVNLGSLICARRCPPTGT
jgi:uncharacterized membrane protein